MSEANSATEGKDGAILIHGARQNHLKNLTLALPLNQLVAVTGAPGFRKADAQV